MPSYKTSMTSQLVLLVSVTIVLMQVYNFIQTREILDIFNSLASMVLWAYFQRNMTPENPKPTPQTVDNLQNQDKSI